MWSRLPWKQWWDLGQIPFISQVWNPPSQKPRKEMWEILDDLPSSRRWVRSCPWEHFIASWSFIEQRGQPTCETKPIRQWSCQISFTFCLSSTASLSLSLAVWMITLLSKQRVHIPREYSSLLSGLHDEKQLSSDNDTNWNISQVWRNKNKIFKLWLKQLMLSINHLTLEWWREMD